MSTPPTKRKELSHSRAPSGQAGGAAEQCPLFLASKMGEKQQGQGGGRHWIERPPLLADLEAKALKASELHGMVISCLPGALRCGNADSGPAKGAHPGWP